MTYHLDPRMPAPEEVIIRDLIDRFAEGWRTDRMPRVDLSLVRMAVFELGMWQTLNP